MSAYHDYHVIVVNIFMSAVFILSQHIIQYKYNVVYTY